MIQTIRIELERYDLRAYRCRVVKYDYYKGRMVLGVALSRTDAHTAVKLAVQSARETRLQMRLAKKS